MQVELGSQYLVHNAYLDKRPILVLVFSVGPCHVNRLINRRLDSDAFDYFGVIRQKLLALKAMLCRWVDNPIVFDSVRGRSAQSDVTTTPGGEQ
jgi:hypothetical protein